MPLIETTLFGTTNKVEKAIQRIKSFAPIENGMGDEPYYVAYSGGKDSDVIRILCDLAGVKHTLEHNHTTVDAPETVRYVRSIPSIHINYPKKSMWQLIAEKKMPPTRLGRYCCEVFKEHGGVGRVTMTGVRWSESVSRKENSDVVKIIGKPKDTQKILAEENANFQLTAKGG